MKDNLNMQELRRLGKEDLLQILGVFIEQNEMLVRDSRKLIHRLDADKNKETPEEALLGMKGQVSYSLAEVSLLLDYAVSVQRQMEQTQKDSKRLLVAARKKSEEIEQEVLEIMDRAQIKMERGLSEPSPLEEISEIIAPVEAEELETGPIDLWDLEQEVDRLLSEFKAEYQQADEEQEGEQRDEA